MNKLIIITVSILIIVIGGVIGFRYIQSFHSVTLKIDDYISSVNIYSAGQKQLLHTVAGDNTSISLREGEYTYEAKGERIGTVTESFSISDDTTLTVSPPYSSTYLSSVLSSQEESIKDIIRNSYTSIIGEYTIHPGILYDKGEWYATILTKTEDDLYGVSETYRVLFHKEGDSWSMIRYPEIVLLSINYPDVPVDILHNVNNITRQY